MPAETSLPSPSGPFEGDSLKGSILMAMPDMADARFNRGVIVMLEHDRNGAMGLMINKPLEAVQFAELLEQLKIPFSTPLPPYPVYFGGPVEIGRGFVLHTSDVMLAHSTTLSSMGPPLGVTTSLDMLEHIAKGTGPAKSRFCLGYTGWSAGQLDQEIKQNAWLHATIDLGLLFDIPAQQCWEKALQLAGIDPGFLSGSAGHA